MIGYKSFDPNITDQYGNHYEIGIKYHSIEPVFGKSGFHFCSRPEDTLRYALSKENFFIFEIEASGKIITYDDEYFGFYDMHSCEDMTILRDIPRFEVVESIVNSHDDYRICRLVSLTNLTTDEIYFILTNTNSELVRNYISYYQFKDLDAFKRKLKKMN